MVGIALTRTLRQVLGEGGIVPSCETDQACGAFRHDSDLLGSERERYGHASPQCSIVRVVPVVCGHVRESLLDLLTGPVAGIGPHPHGGLESLPAGLVAVSHSGEEFSLSCVHAGILPGDP